MRKRIPVAALLALPLFLNIGPNQRAFAVQVHTATITKQEARAGTYLSGDYSSTSATSSIDDGFGGTGSATSTLSVSAGLEKGQVNASGSASSHGPGGGQGGSAETDTILSFQANLPTKLNVVYAFNNMAINLNNGIVFDINPKGWYAEVSTNMSIRLQTYVSAFNNDTMSGGGYLFYAFGADVPGEKISRGPRYPGEDNESMPTADTVTLAGTYLVDPLSSFGAPPPKAGGLYYPVGIADGIGTTGYFYNDTSITLSDLSATSISLDYTFTGPLLTHLLIPNPLAGEDDEFLLHFGGTTVAATPGSDFNFLDYVSGGVNSFSISGIAPGAYGAVGNPFRFATGMKFSEAGTIQLEVVSTHFVPVPEPSTCVLFGLGLLALPLLRRQLYFH